MSVAYQGTQRLTVRKATDDTKSIMAMYADAIVDIIGNCLYQNGWFDIHANFSDGRMISIDEDDSLKSCREKLQDVFELEEGCIELNYDCKDFEAADFLSDLNEYMNTYIVFDENPNWNPEKEQEIRDALLFECWEYVDCSDEGSGQYCAWGNANSVRYDGEVPFRKINAFPKGSWREENGGFANECVYYGMENDPERQKLLENSFRKMQTLWPNLEEFGDMNEDGLCEMIGHLEIVTEEDLKKLVDCVATVLQNSAEFKDASELEFYFHDTEDGCRLLNLTINADGSYKMEIAEIDR